MRTIIAGRPPISASMCAYGASPASASRASSGRTAEDRASGGARDRELTHLGGDIDVRHHARIDVLAHERIPAGARAGRHIDEEVIGAREDAHVGDDASLRAEGRRVLAVARREREHIVRDESREQLGRLRSVEAHASAHAAIDEHRAFLERGVLRGDVAVVQRHRMARDDADRGILARDDLTRGHPAASIGSMASSVSSVSPDERLEHRIRIRDALRAEWRDDRAAQASGARGSRTGGAGLERERGANIERAASIHALERLAIAVGRRLRGMRRPPPR